LVPTGGGTREERRERVGRLREKRENTMPPNKNCTGLGILLHGLGHAVLEIPFLGSVLNDGNDQLVVEFVPST